jgi:transcriptional regulator with XRE-family HTH domain
MSQDPEDNYLIQLGRRLAKVRHDAGLNQIPFAEKLGVSQGAYTGYERGQREIPLKAYKVLYKEYGVLPDWFFFGEGCAYKHELENIRFLIKKFLEKNYDKSSSKAGKEVLLEEELLQIMNAIGSFKEEIAISYMRKK